MPRKPMHATPTSANDHVDNMIHAMRPRMMLNGSSRVSGLALFVWVMCMIASAFNALSRYLARKADEANPARSASRLTNEQINEAISGLRSLGLTTGEAMNAISIAMKSPNPPTDVSTLIARAITHE